MSCLRTVGERSAGPRLDPTDGSRLTGHPDSKHIGLTTILQGCNFCQVSIPFPARFIGVMTDMDVGIDVIVHAMLARKKFLERWP